MCVYVLACLHMRMCSCKSEVAHKGQKKMPDSLAGVTGTCEPPNVDAVIRVSALHWSLVKIFFLNTGSLCVALSDLEITFVDQLVLNSQRPDCFCFRGPRIKRVRHHAWL